MTTQQLITINGRMQSATILACLCLCAISARAWSQNPQAPAAISADVERTGHAPPGHVVLLREGSTLVQTTGIMRRNAENQWTFVIDTPNARDGRVELILLPCATLEEMERVAATSAGVPRFQTTGEAFIYMNKNYFLPTHAPFLVAMENADADQQPDAETPPTGDVDAVVPDDDSPVAEGDSIEDIMQQLEERAGPIARSSAPTGRVNSNTNSTNQIASANGRSLAREELTLMDRRGHLTRGNGGAWVFVFDADAEGLADPPAFIMPCLLLERMQAEARKAGNVAPMLLTGRIFEYHGRSYILPTLYRIPREGTHLTP